VSSRKQDTRVSWVTEGQHEEMRRVKCPSLIIINYVVAHAAISDERHGQRSSRDGVSSSGMGDAEVATCRWWVGWKTSGYRISRACASLCTVCTSSACNDR
jgi:hypothetical protein